MLNLLSSIKQENPFDERDAFADLDCGADRGENNPKSQVCYV